MRRTAALLSILLLAPVVNAQKAATANAYRDLRRASAAIASGELEEAHRLLSALVADAPDFAAAWFQLAICRRLQSDASGAAQAVERAVALDADNVAALVLAVEVFAGVDRMRAVALARQTAATTGDPAALRRVLEVLVELREVAAAEPILDAALADHPKDLSLLEVRARWGLEAKKPEIAVEAYRAMLRIKPVNPPVLHSLAGVLLHLGRRDEARETLERTLKVNPSNIEAREQLIALLEEDGAEAEVLAVQRRYLAYYRHWAQQRAGKGEQARPGK